MVKTRNQAEAAAVDAEQQGAYGVTTFHHTESPRSPSEQPAGPSRVELPVNPLPTLHEHAAASVTGPRQAEPRRQRSPAASRCSSAGSAARRRAQLELEAHERLAEIARREMHMEAELVKKRLALNLEQLDDDRASNTSRVYERVNEWLGRAEQTTYPAATASAAREGTAGGAPPAPCERRGELPTAHRDDERRAAHRDEQHRETTRAPTNDVHHSRSPTPTDQLGRGLEQLAHMLSKMSRDRPPPRQAYELPDFTGAPNEWLPFKAAMGDSTKLYRLSPAENLARLRNCLKGEARDTVAALLHTASSPDVIMKTLEQRYGQPEMIVDRALEDLQRLPQIRAASTELNSFAIRVQNVVAVLESVDKKGYLHTPMLAREVINKLSENLKSKWCDYACDHPADGTADLVRLSEFLMREANRTVQFAFKAAPAGTPAASATATTRPAARSSNTARPARYTGTAEPARNRPRGATVYAASDEERRASQECPCCGGGHRIEACPKLRNMEHDARWEWARSARVCFKCCADKHRRIRCRAPVCGTNGCRRPHHPLLHGNEDPPARAIEDAAATATASQEAVMSIAATNEGRAVLLKVCSVVIAGPAGEVATYALLDEGSTVTLIDQQLADCIGATGTPAPLSLRGVNSVGEQMDSRRVTVQIRGRREPTEHQIAARTVRNLDLRQQSVPRDITRYAHLRRFRDACYANAKPRVLIGADNWHLIVSRQLSVGKKNEPAASRTDLGWVVYGTMPRLLRRTEEDTVLHIHAAERHAEPATTEHNVADDATRAENTPRDRHDRWFSGPAFLYEPEDTWPQVPKACGEEDTEDAHHASDTGGAGALPDISRFSSYERLIRATAAVLAFIDRCRKTTKNIELRHLERAEQLWVAQAQRDSFGAEIDRLHAGRTLPATSRLAKLDPIIEDGLLRVRGRINAADAPAGAKRPLILDGRHPLTRLIVLKEHAAAGHASNERVLNDLRQRLWILRARPTVRAVARTCALCRVRRAKPRVPPMGDLPPARLDPYCRPFTNCGVDYFGPMLVKVGRRREKRWGALFTCLTTRAVHIELVGSLNIDSAIMALRRMAARRGWPRQVWSDNATNFRGADAELRAAYKEWAPALRDRALLQRVDWRFIAPGAPNQGGAWERLVRSIKTALRSTLNEQVPHEEVLHTLLLEAEHAVNARPLTHVTTDPEDPEALTPNHFLIGASTGLPQSGQCDPADRRKWRAVQGLADQFWRRWVREYLPTLVPRGGASDRQRPLREGDLVLVVDPSLPRNTWPRGVIERVHTGPDGDVRSAEIRTKGGVFTRPTRKLAVLPT